MGEDGVAAQRRQHSQTSTSMNFQRSAWSSRVGAGPSVPTPLPRRAKAPPRGGGGGIHRRPKKPARTSQSFCLCRFFLFDPQRGGGLARQRYWIVQCRFDVRQQRHMAFLESLRDENAAVGLQQGRHRPREGARIGTGVVVFSPTCRRVDRRPSKAFSSISAPGGRARDPGPSETGPG